MIILRGISLFFVAVVAILFALPSFADQTCTAQAPGSHCNFTLYCDVDQTCKETYVVGGGATISVNTQCQQTNVEEEINCASPDIWQGSCKWNPPGTCGCNSTAQGFKLNVAVKCKDPSE